MPLDKQDSSPVVSEEISLDDRESMKVPSLEDIPAPQLPDLSQFMLKDPAAEQKGFGSTSLNIFWGERQSLLNPTGVASPEDIDKAASEDRALIEKMTRRTLENDLNMRAQLKFHSIQEDLLITLDEARRMSAAANPQEVEALMSWTTQFDQLLKENSKAAVSQAVVETLAPENMALSEKDFYAFQDYMGATVAKRIGERKILTFGFDNYVADLAALFVPFRMFASSSAFGSTKGEVLPWFGRYYDRLHEWRRMNTGAQRKVWDQWEQEIWDASGNNMLVYMSLALPFIDPNHDIWTKIDSGLDVLGVSAYLGLARKLWNAGGKTANLIKVRSLANRLGNPPAAGRLVVEEIKKGNPEAVVEGHPVKIPAAKETNPEFVEEASFPAQNTLVDELIANGIVREGAGDIPVESIPVLTDGERTLAVDRRRAYVLGNGEIIGEQVDETGVLFEVRRPVNVTMSPSDVVKEIKTLRTQLKDLRKNLSVALADDDSAKVKTLMGEIERSKARLDIYREAAKQGKKLAKGGTKVKGLRVPSSTLTENAKVYFNFTVDDVGFIKFSEGDIGLFADYFLSQEFKLDRFLKGGTALGSHIAAQQRSVLGHILRKEKEIRKTLRGSNPLVGGFRSLLGTNEVKRVDSVLLKGDELQTTFSDEMLQLGIETSEGHIRLEPHEVQAYKDMRDLYDSLWRMLNKTRRDDLAFSGQSSFRVNHVSKDGTIRQVNVYAKADELGSVRPVDKDVLRGEVHARHVIDASTGNVVDLDKIPDLEKLLSSGRKAFVKLHDDFIQGDGHYYRYMLVDVHKQNGIRKAKNALELPEHVLDYRRGYVPKLITNPVNFVVEEAGDLIRNGQKVRDVRVIRGFQNRREAEIFIKQKQASFLDRTVGPPEEGATPLERWTINALDDNYRKSHPERAEFVNQNLFSGAFAGTRTDGVFRVGLDGDPGTRMSAFEALRRYGDFVARNAPMHQYKSAMIKRFFESIKDPSEGTKMLEVPWDWTSKITLSGSDPRYAGAKAMQDWMKATFAVPTSSERHWDKFTHRLMHTLDRAIYKDKLGNMRWGGSLTYRLQNKLGTSRWAKDPIQAAKSLTFDMMLGMFNHAQLLIQSAGMAVPLSLHPIEGIAVLPKFSALRVLWPMRNADDAAQVAKVVGLSPTEFKHMWTSFRRSGVADSVIENADFGHYVTTAHGYYSVDFLTKIRESGRFFYTQGELNNRMFSWSMAYERLMKSKGWSPLKQLTSAQIVEINEEALRIGMNMTQANRAFWQQGILGIPTQFMQVTFKYYENLYAGIFNAAKGGKWTRTEAFTSGALSTIAFGAAGWSVDEWWSQYETYLTDPKGFFALDREKHKDVLAAFREGTFGFLAGETVGFGIDISDRVALGSGINMFIDNIARPLVETVFMGDPSGVNKMLMGASATVATRTHTALASVLSLFTTDLVNGNFNESEIKQAVVDVLSMSSTASNAFKAMQWKAANDITLPSTGEALGAVPPGETLDPAVWRMKALGFDPLFLEKFYIQDRKSREYDRLKQEVSAEVYKEYRKLWLDQSRFEDPRQRSLVSARVAVMVKDLDEKDREDVLKRAMELADEEPRTSKLIERMFKRFMGQSDEQEQQKTLEGITTLSESDVYTKED